MSFLATEVVQPLSVVLVRTVPVATAGQADAQIFSETVGMAVPVAFFHTSIVIVPASTVTLKAAIVQA